MSLLNFNTPNKQWNMYLNTLSSISGDNLTIKPDARRNLLLEVSGNNNIFIKRGDVSYNLSNLITGDVSFSNVDVSVNLNPLTNNNGSLGSSNKLWSNAYIRDISATNISISGNMTISGTISNVIQIIPRLANDISSSLGNNTNIWQRAFIRDLSNISTINGTNWPITGSTGPTGPTGLTGPTGPMGAIGPAGTTITATWSDISNLRLTTYHRIYQEISGGINDLSWAAVNGYYGLAKDAYPSLNPLSSGVKAVQTWTQRTTGLYESTGICWSPELGRFVAVTSDTVYTSTNGINWSSVTAITGYWWNSVCWSPQLKIFVAVADTGGGVMTSANGIIWSLTIVTDFQWSSVCWSPELGLFVAVSLNTNGGRLMTSRNGTSWSQYYVGNYTLRSVCWSAELGIFVIITYNSFVFTSNNGIDWLISSIPSSSAWECVCWSPQLGIFLAIAYHDAKLMTSSNGINWIERAISTPVPAANTFPNMGWMGVCWCAEIGLFVAVAQTGSPRVMTSHNGINWISRTCPTTLFKSVCWSPELGLVVATGSNFIMTSSLKGRPPTSYNVFDSSFNRIDENGKWDFSNINVITLTVNNGPRIISDDRLKHNEVVINNGLDVIDKLTPKFYQKTQVLLDASYNGDLSNYAWNHEAGLIAQELLQINDLSYVVSGGDYYKQTYTMRNANYDISAINYEVSAINYEVSNINYEVSNNLIAQPYNVNYNSVFIYGLAAIKELHAKFKSQQATLLNQKNIINSLLTKIEILENNRTN